MPILRPHFSFVLADASPEDAGGAKIFRTRVFIDGELEYDVVGGREPPGVLLLPNRSKSGHVPLRSIDNRGLQVASTARWVDGEETFTYRFVLFNPQNINSVRFELDIANDYQVELSTNSAAYDIPPPIPSKVKLSAPGNVTDDSNRRVHQFNYGELTDETTMGFDLQTTLFGFSIEAERAWYLQTDAVSAPHRTENATNGRRVVSRHQFGILARLLGVANTHE